MYYVSSVLKDPLLVTLCSTLLGDLLPNEYRGQTAAPVLLDLEAAAAARARLLGSPVAGLVPPPPSLTPPADFWRFNHRPTAAALLQLVDLFAAAALLQQHLLPVINHKIYVIIRGCASTAALVSCVPTTLPYHLISTL